MKKRGEWPHSPYNKLNHKVFSYFIVVDGDLSPTINDKSQNFWHLSSERFHQQA